ncbi:cytochrome c [Falsiroseomonas selenitidurans]|uniref:Cytochrome c n=1 Tax=Falsiroseomonas selenitidurans TaxID=2716335 RepID=A0ABX1E9P2_9PROT|nr:cytochrome c [Falsiroseomonas selenitidurans]NKC33950.1 cytochrome c [Falsiroseomonas selenitidurans]
MRGWIGAAGALVAMGFAGSALAQGDVIADRRAGLRGLGQGMEAIAQTVQSRGDTRALAARIDAMSAFVATLPNLVPTESLTPPQAQGTQPGQTRALAAIAADRAGFQTRANNMVAALATLKTAAQAGSIAPDLLRSTGGTCGACHQQFRAR